MLKRLCAVGLALLIGLPAPFGSLATARAAAPANQPDDFEGGLQLLAADAQGLTLALETPSYQIAERREQGVAYQELTVPGSFFTQEPGHPQLPMVSALLAVPPHAQVSLEVQTAEAHTLPGTYHLLPAVAPAPLAGDLQAGALIRQPDGEAYARDGLYPANPARLAGEAWLRDQRLVRVELFPFQYNPARGALRWHPRLVVRLHFSGNAGASVRCLGDCGRPSPFQPLLARSLLNASQAAAWRGLPDAPATPQIPLPLPPLTGGPYYKIAVSRDGLYALTYADLQAAGLNLASLDPRQLRLSSQGRDVAIYVEGEADGRFDPGDRLLFYGQKLRGDLLAADYATWMADWLWLCPACRLEGMFEKYTDENVYWLSVGTSPGPRMGAVDADPTGSSASVPAYYTATVRAEEDHTWYSHHFSSEDTWFWERIQPGPSSITRTYTTTLTALASASLTATVRAEVVSRSSNTHITRFYLNGGAAPLDQAIWSGKTNYTFAAQVPQAQLLAGENALDFALIYSPTLQNFQDMYFNWFEVDYGRAFQAQADQLTFGYERPGTWKFQLDDLQSAAVRALEITDPLTPTRLLNPVVSAGPGGYTATFVATVGPGARYFVAGEGAVMSPGALTPYTPLDFASLPGADYLLIAPAEFLTATQALADYRATRGLSTLVVPLEELIDQFNAGIYHPVAIKNFLAYTFNQWATPPAYVVLVGGGHWNFKGFDGYSAPPIHMPPNLAFVDPWQGEVDSANLLATLVGDDFLPDLMIGRLPANSVAELDTMIAKIQAYESAAPQGWQRHFLFVADNVPDSAGDFVALADGIIDDYLAASPYYQADRIYLNDYCGPPTSPPTTCPPVNHAITTTLNITGALLVNYIGHASVNRWAHEKIFVNADVATLTNMAQLPVVLSMTCLDGYWIHPDLASLVYDLLRSEQGGSVATFSATGLGVATGHDWLQRGFFDALLVDGTWRMGQAAQSAKLNLFTSGWNYDLLHTFTVFGDPALHLPSQYAVDLAPEAASAMGDPGAVVQYSVQVTNTGLLTDTFDVSVSANTWPTQPGTNVLGPLAPGQSAALTVSVTIPPGQPGADTAYLQVTSQGDPALVRATALTTISISGRVFLPAIRR